MGYQEDPAIADAINDIVLRYGPAEWFVSASQVSDDAGRRVLVMVNALYLEDVLPRKMGDVFLVVQVWVPPVKYKETV